MTTKAKLTVKAGAKPKGKPSAKAAAEKIIKARKGKGK